MSRGSGDTLTSVDEQLLRRWEDALADAATVRQDPHGTIVPPTRAPDSAARRALELLVRAGGDERIAIVGTVAQGGMGIVHLGEQLSLGRKVAVKSLPAGTRTEAAAMTLLREAWVMGGLEHPNILPVYDVGLDATGCPQVVLKHVQGLEWSKLMRDEDAVRARGGGDDLLAFNLQTLMQVCRAIAFAHSRGVLHRDLKPSNVMVGEFGEIYVLDWGLAVSLRDDCGGRFQLASDVGTEIAGTPGYMAPEMLGKGPLDERTDVYLLGAVLYEILAGVAPHASDDPIETLGRALASEPPPPPDAPPELVAISLRAMRRDARERYGSAEELRLAIQGCLARRGSLRLAENAARRLEALDRELASRDPERRIAVYRLFGECRFGFREALERWPDNELGRSGLARAVAVMVDFELASGNARAADALLADLAEPPPDLRARVTEALRAAELNEQRIAELERLGRQLDRRVGERARLVIGVVLGGLATVAPLSEARRHGAAPESFSQGLIWPAVFALLLALLGFSTRKTMMRTVVNRRVLATIVLLLAAQVVLALGVRLLGMSPTNAVVLNFLLWSLATATLALAVDRRLTATAAGYALAFLAAARWPAQRYYFMSAANLLLTLNVALIWGRRSGERASVPESRA
jgi:serine/threonine-protein kinase